MENKSDIFLRHNGMELFKYVGIFQKFLVVWKYKMNNWARFRCGVILTTYPLRTKQSVDFDFLPIKFHLYTSQKQKFDTGV